MATNTAPASTIQNLKVSNTNDSVWYQIFEPETDRILYVNPDLGECSSDYPPHGFVMKRNPEEVWWELIDENTNLPYYFNSKNMETVWIPPEDSLTISAQPFMESGDSGRRLSQGLVNLARSSMSEKDVLDLDNTLIAHSLLFDDEYTELKKSIESSFDNINKSPNLCTSLDGNLAGNFFKNKTENDSTIFDTDYIIESYVYDQETGSHSNVNSKLSLTNFTNDIDHSNQEQIAENDEKKNKSIHANNRISDTLLLKNKRKGINSKNKKTRETKSLIYSNRPKSTNTNSLFVNNLSDIRNSFDYDWEAFLDSQLGSSDGKIKPNYESEKDKGDKGQQKCQELASEAEPNIKKNYATSYESDTKTKKTRNSFEEMLFSEFCNISEFSQISGNETSSNVHTVSVNNSKDKSAPLDYPEFSLAYLNLNDSYNEPAKNQEHLDGNNLYSSATTGIDSSYNSSVENKTNSSVADIAMRGSKDVTPMIVVRKTSMQGSNVHTGEFKKYINNNVKQVEKAKPAGLDDFLASGDLETMAEDKIKKDLEKKKRLSTRSIPGVIEENDLSYASFYSYAIDKFCTTRKGFFKKSMEIDDLYSYTDSPITQSLTYLPKSLQKDAIKSFKIILNLLNSRSSLDKNENVELILNILGIPSLSSVDFHDELYSQVCKVLVRNNSIKKLEVGWILLSIFAISFTPSKSAYPYFNNFIIDQAKRLKSLQNALADTGNLLNIISHTFSRLTNTYSKANNTRSLGSEEIKLIVISSTRNQLFGVPLDSIMTTPEFVDKKFNVPSILRVLTEAIVELGGHKTEGLFRVPGDSDKVYLTRLQLEAGFSLKYTKDKLNVYASLLKEWLRELKTPLIPVSNYLLCTGNPKDLKIAYRVLNKLPVHHHKTCVFLLNFLNFLAKEENSQITKMDASNLALVFSPYFLRNPIQDLKLSLANSPAEQEFVKILILNPPE
ncbi:Rho GTPase-activating protein 39 [Smittium culicis]|uniref:Rho GTPase-activating protein 39 n=1 Tax=Smittium culicis TaxID=133412 RepID=A0A1R1YDD7_9FUNG|nr:Rho GTPase-activating protein 39 [Smittium culicis]